MTESSRLRFDLYSWGALTVLLVGTGVYFACHLAWNLILESFLLVCIGAFSAVAGFYRTWREVASVNFAQSSREKACLSHKARENFVREIRRPSKPRDSFRYRECSRDRIAEPGVVRSV